VVHTRERVFSRLAIHKHIETVVARSISMESTLVSDMSSPEVSKAEKKPKIVEKRHWGPADGFRYNIEETFVSPSQQYARLT
jgi:hypothetical protein